MGFRFSSVSGHFPFTSKHRSIRADLGLSCGLQAYSILLFAPDTLVVVGQLNNKEKWTRNISHGLGVGKTVKEIDKRHLKVSGKDGSKYKPSLKATNSLYLLDSR